MKTILSILFIFLLSFQSFSQSADSIKINTKNCKNNLQTSLLGFGGYFGLQYERALSKDWSVSLIGMYRFPFSQLNQPDRQGTPKVYTEKYSIQAELRYYLDRNEINNNGLYISADIGYAYRIQYISENKNTYYEKRKYPWVGGNIGYQLLIKKRLVLDAGIGLQYGMKLQSQGISNNYTGWEKMEYREVYLPITFSIGYAF